jgi:hypothetical protein
MEEPELPERIVTLLVSSDYARLVGRTKSTRRDYLVDIASLHTKDELLQQPRLGRTTVRQIERWLEFHGRRFRRPNESLDTVICGFEFRKRRARRPKSRNGLRPEGEAAS